MNSLIPALIAVLLAEIGGRSALFVRLPRLALAAAVLGVAVGVSAIAGAAMTPAMNAQARALMLGIALIFGGAGQLGRVSPALPGTVFGTLVFVSRSGVPLLAFAFAIWKGSAVGAALGTLAGFVGAVALGAILVDQMSGQVGSWVRRACGLTITVIGIYAALWALRLA